MLVPNNRNAATHKVWAYKTNVHSTIVCPLWAHPSYTLEYPISF